MCVEKGGGRGGKLNCGKEGRIQQTCICLKTWTQCEHEIASPIQVVADMNRFVIGYSLEIPFSQKYLWELYLPDNSKMKPNCIDGFNIGGYAHDRLLY